jgi:hypothetical protein
MAAMQRAYCHTHRNAKGELPMKNANTIRATLLIMVATTATATASATPIGGGVDHTDPTHYCNTIYVSPDLAIGDNSNPGTMREPLRNIQDAIYLAGLDKPAVVVLLPGTYSASTNYESFPIYMDEDVSLQGTSAMNTILDGEGYGTDLVWFYGMYGDFDETYLDSVTLRRGDYAINMESEYNPVGPTISNSVITDNNIGVRMVAVWEHDSETYPHFFPRIVNNTIVENTIGIFDQAKPGIGGPLDGKGVAEPAIINNIIKFNTTWDLAGVDSTDIKNCVFGDQNAWMVDGALPFTWSWAGNMTIGNTFVNAYDGDYRLLPDTLVEDMGTLSLQVGNGNIVTPESPCGMDIFDFDGEGYGNERLVAAVDLGADERSDLLIAGYIPWTTKFGTYNGQTYNTMHVNVAPKTSVGDMLNVRLWFAKGAPRWNKLGAAPGARAKGSARMSLTSNFGKLWLQRNAQISTQAVYVPAKSWFNLPVPASSTPCHWNTQCLAKGNTAFTDLSNLQSFLAD